MERRGGLSDIDNSAFCKERLQTKGLLFNKAVALCQTRKLQPVTTENSYQLHQIKLERKLYYIARSVSPSTQLPRLLHVIQCS